MRKVLNSLFIIALAVIAVSCSSDISGVDSLPQTGVAIYKFEDTFMSGIRTSISTAAEGKISVDIVDSQNSQPKQNDKVDLFISKKMKAMAVNPVERTSVGNIIEKAKAANIPVVFMNREPLADDLAKWDKAFFVGAKAEESGTMEGEILVEYWRANPSMDKNGDGILQYVMLKGEPGHQDAELRTKYSVLAIEEAGIRVQALGEDTAMFDRVKGQEKMAAFLAAYGDNIEAVIANNDDMALGAISALKEAGYFENGKFMPVVGVDATEPAMQALRDGTLLGTVLNDADNQGIATVELMRVLAAGETPSKENTGYEISDGKYVWIPYQKVTQ